MTRSSQQPPLDDQTIASVDSAVQRWRAAIQSSPDSDMAQFLPPVGSPLRHNVLTNLASAELDVRIRRGETFRVETLLSSHDELTSDDILPLIVAELRARQSSGEQVKRRDYRERFPDHYEALKRLATTSQKTHQTLVARPTPRRRELPTGKRLGDYEIVKRLGTGSYADVYLAKQNSLGREVAIKISAEKKNEARALAKLDHPNIVPVYSEHNVANRHLLVMRYVQGHSLGEWLQHKDDSDASGWSGRDFIDWLRDDAPGNNSEGDREIANTGDLTAVSCRIVLDVARALAHAHDRGVLHLDIKPANIMLDTNGRGMLMDFNVAALPDESGLRSTKPSGGTLAYMPPEQLSHFVGETKALKSQVGTTTDLYALGVVFYELLSGTSPWSVPDGDSNPNAAVQMLAERMRPPKRLDEVLPEISPKLASLVERMLATAAEDRYPNAQSVVAELKQYLSNPPSITDKATVSNFVWRNRAKLSAIAAAIVAGVAILGWQVLSPDSVEEKRTNGPEVSGISRGNAANDPKVGVAPIPTKVVDKSTPTPEAPDNPNPQPPTTKGQSDADPSDPSVIDIVTRGRSHPLDSHIRRAMIKGRREREFTINPIMLYGTEIPLNWEETYSRLRRDEIHSRMLDESVTEILLFQLFAKTKTGEDEEKAKSYFFSRLPAEHEQLPLIETLRRRLTKQPIADIPTASLLVIAKSEFERYLLGVVAAIREEHDTAITLFQNCKAENPERHTTLFYFGISAERAGRESEAIRAYTACIAHHPDFFPPYFCLGMMRKKRGEFDMVKKTFRRVLDEHPDQVEHYISLASIFSQMDQDEESVAVLNRAIKHGLESPVILTRRAMAHRKMGNAPSAKKDLQDALALDPTFRPAKRELQFMTEGRKPR